MFRYSYIQGYILLITKMEKNIHAEMEDLHHKVLNPNQRQIIEDSRRLKEKLAQINKGFKKF